MVDPETGADLLFLSAGAASDTSFYYEQRSWLADSSLIIFSSSRPNGGLMGYIVQTGELVRLTTPTGGLGGPTCAQRRNSVFGMRGLEVVELALRIIAPPAPGQPSRVVATERVIGVIPADHVSTNTALSENANGRMLAVGTGGRGASLPAVPGRVTTIDVRSGAVRDVYACPAADFSGHVVCSRDDPNLISFGLAGAWLSVVDVRTGKLVFRHRQVKGEFCTHHCWWRGSLITFCGGFHPQPLEDADVKTLDIRTGEVRIVGRGNWWPGARSIDLARANWWHSAGDENGRWIAADNWHGDIGIFHAATTRTYILTRGHRTYGKGQHPEVGWDRKSEQVLFSSGMLGPVHACVATIPRAWQEAWKGQVSGPN